MASDPESRDAEFLSTREGRRRIFPFYTAPTGVVFRVTVLSLFRLLYRLSWTGAHHLPKDGPFIIASNHQSFFDPPIVGVPLRRRLFRYVSSVKYFNHPFAWAMRAQRTIGIDLTARFDRKAYEECMRTLRCGQGLVIFPEGTRSRNGRVKKLETGVARMALLTGATILPAVITGAYDVWPRGRKTPRLTGRIHVKYYSPIRVERCKARDELSARSEEITRRIERTLTRRVDAYYRHMARRQAAPTRSRWR